MTVQRLEMVVMEPDLVEDANLLRGYIAGDSHAFARLYDRYDRSCFLFIRRVLGASHVDVAEDLHQETWISISKSAAMFDPAKGNFRTWMFTIARRKVWDHFRRQKVVVLTSAQDDAVMAVADQSPTPLAQVESRELAQKLVDAVEALPLAQRDVFVMFAHAGLSLEEISDIAGVGVETIKSRLRYARTTLRQALAAERSTYV